MTEYMLLEAISKYTKEKVIGSSQCSFTKGTSIIVTVKKLPTPNTFSPSKPAINNGHWE